MKGLPTVRFVPARNVEVAPSVIGGTEFGKGDGQATGVPIVQPPLNSHPDAVTPNTTTAAPATPEFGKGDFAPGTTHSSYEHAGATTDPDDGVAADGSVDGK